MAQISELERKLTEASSARNADGPRAVRASCVDEQLLIQLSTGYGIVVPAHTLQGLETATPDELSVIEISPSGLGLHFPRVDADIYLPALLAGVFGSENWIAARLGKKGGQVRSAAKSISSRENGRRGGRPRRAEGEA